MHARDHGVATYVYGKYSLARDLERLRLRLLLHGSLFHLFSPSLSLSCCCDSGLNEKEVCTRDKWAGRRINDDGENGSIKKKKKMHAR
jgi:hypothetical protein